MHSVRRMKPSRLRKGDTIGVIAPASCGNTETTAAGVEWLEKTGFRIKLGKTVSLENGYLAGSDAARAADINSMFAADDIDGIICLRGGYGTMRLLNLIDYDTIKKHPKVFVGYSDITALHTAIGQRTGLVTFHGPMAASDMGKNIPAYTWNWFLRAVTGAGPLGNITNPPDAEPFKVIASGKAAGFLAGGNLSLIAATLGTPYEIDTCGKILFMEEVSEAPYRIDRMLTQLLLAGKLQTAAGIVFDVFAGFAPETESADFTVEEVLKDRLGSLNIPIIMNVYFGHTANKITVPLRIRAMLQTQNGRLTITESATID